MIKMPTLNSRNLFLVVLFQIIILVLMVFNSYSVLLWGDEVTVEVEPVDPRSLFQGDYVRLSYPFSNLDLNTISYDFDPSQLKRQDTIYLAMKKDGSTAVPIFATQDAKKVRGMIYLQGQLLYIQPVSMSKEKSNILHISWGIENYYLPEGTGRELQRDIQGGNIYAKIAIYKGRARIIELINTK